MKSNNPIKNKGRKPRYPLVWVAFLTGASLLLMDAGWHSSAKGNYATVSGLMGYWRSGQWRADVRTLAAAAHYLLEPEPTREGTNSMTVQPQFTVVTGMTVRALARTNVASIGPESAEPAMLDRTNSTRSEPAWLTNGGSLSGCLQGGSTHCPAACRQVL
jgi:hypothetical protein